MGRGDLNASNLVQGASQRGAATSDRDMEAAITKVLTAKFGLSERVVQDLQSLSGLRSEPGDGKRPKAAVRRGDLYVIGRMDEMSSREVTGNVTVQDFNDLRNDVRRLYEVMASISRALGGA